MSCGYRARALILCLSVFVAACTRPATQLVPVINSDLRADDIQCVLVEAAEYTGRGFAPTTSPALFHVNRPGPRTVSLPFSMGIVPPASGHTARVEVRTHALRNCTDLVTPTNRSVTRIVRTGFRQDQSLRLPIFLSATCTDVLCGEGLTCEAGACVPISVIEPSDLRAAIPGQELIDPDMDAGTHMDARATDAFDPFDTRVDVGQPDTGPRPDAPLPDAGSVCPTTPSTLGNTGDPNAIIAYGLGQSADGLRLARSYVFAGSVRSGANSPEYGGGFFVSPGLVNGPTGVALLDTGMQGAFVFTHVTGGIRFYSSSARQQQLGGACPTSRCIAEFNGNFVVLRGPSNLSLDEISPAAVVIGSQNRFVSGTTAGAIRSIDVGALVTYTSGGICTLKRWPDRTAPIATLTVPSCRQLDMAQLDDGQIALTWIDTTFAVHIALSDASLSAVSAEAIIDGAQTALQPVEVNATRTGFRVTWVDDLATPLLRSVGFDTMGAPLRTECAANPTHALANYRQFHAVRRGGTSAIEWVQGNTFYGVTLTD